MMYEYKKLSDNTRITYSKVFNTERLTIKCQPSKGWWWQKNRWLSKRYNKAEVHKNPGAGKQEVVTLPNYNKAFVISP